MHFSIHFLCSWLLFVVFFFNFLFRFFLNIFSCTFYHLIFFFPWLHKTLHFFPTLLFSISISSYFYSSLFWYISIFIPLFDPHIYSSSFFVISISSYPSVSILPIFHFSLYLFCVSSRLYFSSFPKAASVTRLIFCLFALSSSKGVCHYKEVYECFPFITL